MKVYVDELPKSCKDCFFCEHIEENIDGKGRDEVACYFEGFLNNVLLGETFNAKNCKHLQSLADYTKQVRKEVVEFIDKCFEMQKYESIFINPDKTEFSCDVSYAYEWWESFKKILLDQIQGEDNGII